MTIWKYLQAAAVITLAAVIFMLGANHREARFCHDCPIQRPHWHSGR